MTLIVIGDFDGDDSNVMVVLLTVTRTLKVIVMVMVMMIAEVRYHCCNQRSSSNPRTAKILLPFTRN